MHIMEFVMSIFAQLLALAMIGLISAIIVAGIYYFVKSSIETLHKVIIKVLPSGVAISLRSRLTEFKIIKKVKKIDKNNLFQPVLKKIRTIVSRELVELLNKEKILRKNQKDSQRINDYWKGNSQGEPAWGLKNLVFDKDMRETNTQFKDKLSLVTGQIYSIQQFLDWFLLQLSKIEVDGLQNIDVESVIFNSHEELNRLLMANQEVESLSEQESLSSLPVIVSERTEPCSRRTKPQKQPTAS